MKKRNKKKVQKRTNNQPEITQNTKPKNLEATFTGEEISNLVNELGERFNGKTLDLSEFGVKTIE